MTAPPRNLPPRFALILVVSASFVFALLLRVWHIRWGAPFDYHPEEQRVYDAAVAMVRGGKLNPGVFDWPSLLFMIEAALVHGLHWIAHTPLEIASGPQVSPGMFPEGQWGYLVLGRLAVALMGAASVAFVAAAAGQVAKGFRPPDGRSGIGLLALLVGLLAAVIPLHLRHSHYLTPDVPAALGVSMGLYIAVRVLNEGAGRRLALWAGVAIGLATGFKYAAALTAVPVCMAFLLAPGSAFGRTIHLALAGLVSVAVFLVGTPSVLLDPSAFWDGLTVTAAHPLGGRVGPESVSGLGGVWGYLWHQDAIGPGAMILALAAVPLSWLLRAGRSGRRPTLVFFSLLLAYLAVYATVGRHFDGAGVALVPAVVLLVAVSAAILTAAVRKVARVAMGMLLIAALVPTALEGGATARQLGLQRTETQAYVWFQRSVPEGARVLREWYTPHLRPRRFAVEVTEAVGQLGAERLAGERLDYVVLSSKVFGHLAGEGGDSSGVYHSYEEIFSGGAAAVFCPEPGVSTGPEVWIFARSQRARDLHDTRLIQGVCGPWPW